MTSYIDLLAAHDKLEAQNAELLGILSRLQSEHCDLIERENALESKLAAVPRYVFWCPTNENAGGTYSLPFASG